MGLLFIDSLKRRDYPVLIALNLLADILYAVIDPHIHYS